jgi:hypothetical protein
VPHRPRRSWNSRLSRMRRRVILGARPGPRRPTRQECQFQHVAQDVAAHVAGKMCPFSSNPGCSRSAWAVSRVPLGLAVFWTLCYKHGTWENFLYIGCWLLSVTQPKTTTLISSIVYLKPKTEHLRLTPRQTPQPEATTPSYQHRRYHGEEKYGTEKSPK